jgi:hypothetical protein
VVAKKETRLQSEREIPCPCCGAVLVIDLNLGRVISHREPDSGLNIELSDAQRILAEEKARREAAFELSVSTERTKGDALSKRFEEALKQAREEPITKPTRDFDLDGPLSRVAPSAPVAPVPPCIVRLSESSRTTSIAAAAWMDARFPSAPSRC